MVQAVSLHSFVNEGGRLRTLRGLHLHAALFVAQLQNSSF